MRIHIALDNGLVAEPDRRAGARSRSAFVAELVKRGLGDERRWDDIEAALATGDVDDFPMLEIDVQHWPVGT